MMQNNNFRSATNLRSLGRSRSDNTFATATNLGSISPNTTRATFSASGTVGRSDSVDFYKFTAFPGANLPSGRSSFRLRNGSALVSVYAEALGTRGLATKFRLQRGSASTADSAVNPTQFSITVYLKLERRIKETQYSFTLDLFR